MKLFLFAAALGFSSVAFSTEYIPVAEVCIDQGPCAFRIPYPGLEQQGVFIVTADDQAVIRQALPDAHLFIATAEEYTAAKGQFKAGFDQILIDDAGNELVTMRKGGTPAPAPAPKPAPAPSGSGPLIGGSISIGNITIGGTPSCTMSGCHSASNPHGDKATQSDK